MFSSGRIARTVVVGMVGAAVIGFTNVPRAYAAEDQAKTAQHKQAKMPTISELMKMDPMQVMDMIDTQHKGYVTEAEFRKFMEQVYRETDNNHDGKVDRPEWHGP